MIGRANATTDCDDSRPNERIPTGAIALSPVRRGARNAFAARRSCIRQLYLHNIVILVLLPQSIHLLWAATGITALSDVSRTERECMYYGMWVRKIHSRPCHTSNVRPLMHIATMSMEEPYAGSWEERYEHVRCLGQARQEMRGAHNKCRLRCRIVAVTRARTSLNRIQLRVRLPLSSPSFGCQSPAIGTHGRYHHYLRLEHNVFIYISMSVCIRVDACAQWHNGADSITTLPCRSRAIAQMAKAVGKQLHKFCRAPSVEIGTYTMLCILWTYTMLCKKLCMCVVVVVIGI